MDGLGKSGKITSAAEVPKVGDIGNVFAMHEPHHMLAKLLWEIHELTTSMSVWVENEQFPVSIFRSWNAAVTAWHITDWLWASSKETRDLMRKRYDVFDDETKKGLRKGLGVFQDRIAEDCRELYLCREIANGSKHMRTEKRDEKVRALAKWDPVIEGAVTCH
jgi:hypothetical protein